MNPLLLAGVSATKHAILRTISVVAVLLVVAGLSWAVYSGIIRPVTKPNPSNTQQGARDNYNVTIAPKSYFGCQKFDIKKPVYKPVNTLKN